MLRLGIVSEKTQKVNEQLDKRFEQASIIFLDEEVLMNNIKRQKRLEETV